MQSHESKSNQDSDLDNIIVEGGIPHHDFGHEAFDAYHEAPTPQHMIVHRNNDSEQLHQIENSVLAAFPAEDNVAAAKIFADDKIKKLSLKELEKHPHRPAYAAELAYRKYKQANEKCEAIKKEVEQAKLEIDFLTLEIAFVEKKKAELNKKIKNTMLNEEYKAEVNLETINNEVKNHQKTIDNYKIRKEKLAGYVHSQKDPLEHARIARNHALSDFTSHFNKRYWLTWLLRVAMILDDVPFSLYQIMMGSDTISDFLKLLNKPPVSGEVNAALVDPFAGGDFLFNMVAINAGLETEKDCLKHYEEYGSLNFRDITKKDFAALKTALRDKSVGTLITESAMSLFHGYVKFVHNFFGAAANSYAMYSTFPLLQEIGGFDWAIFGPMISLGILYYSILMSPKYDKGGVILQQLGKVSAQHIYRDKDFARSYIMFSRAIIASMLLRALSFATISIQVKSIKPSPVEFVPDEVLKLIMFLTVAFHTLRTRAPRTYTSLFGDKDTLMEEYGLTWEQIREQTHEIASVLNKKERAQNVLKNLLPSALSGGFVSVLAYYYSKPAFDAMYNDEDAVLGSQIAMGAALGLLGYYFYNKALTQSMLEGRLLNSLKFKASEPVVVHPSVISLIEDNEMTNMEKLVSCMLNSVSAQNMLFFMACLIAGTSAFSRVESGEYPTALEIRGSLPAVVLVMCVTLLLGEQSFNSFEVFVGDVFSSLQYHSQWMAKAFCCKNDELPLDYEWEEEQATLGNADQETGFASEDEEEDVDPESLILKQPNICTRASECLTSFFGRTRPSNIDPARLLAGSSTELSHSSFGMGGAK